MNAGVAKYLYTNIANIRGIRKMKFNILHRLWYRINNPKVAESMTVEYILKTLDANHVAATKTEDLVLPIKFNKDTKYAQHNYDEERKLKKEHKDKHILKISNRGKKLLSKYQKMKQPGDKELAYDEKAIIGISWRVSLEFRDQTIEEYYTKDS